MNIKKVTLSLLLLAAFGGSSSQASYAHLDGTPTITDQIENCIDDATGKVNDTALVLSDAGIDASIGMFDTSLWKSKDGSKEVKFGWSLSLMKLLQGKISLNDLVGPAFDFKTTVPGCDQKLGLKLKLFTLLSYAKAFSSIKLPGSMNELLSGLSKKFGTYIKTSDKSVAAGLLLYFWLNHCGGAAQFIKGDDKKDKTIAQKRMAFSALLAFVASYSIKNYLGSGAVA
ncbi:hypothetical protein EBU24_03890 [bacterium]|nr:hypothetical protein [bacterium]